MTKRASLSPPLVGGLLAVALLVVTAVAAQTYVGTRWHGDIELFHTHAVAFVEGRLTDTPYLSWYPPLTLVALALPLLLAPALPLYTFAFALEMSVLAGLGALLVRPVASRLRRPPWLGGLPAYAAFALLGAFVIPLRFDMFPVLLLSAGLAAAATRRPILAGLCLGAGAAVKIFPAVALPAILGWYWFGGDRRAAWLAAAGFVAAVLVGFGLYLLFPPFSPLDLVRFQAGRAIQLESLPGSVLAALASFEVIGGHTVAFGDFSFNLSGPAVAPMLGVTKALQPVALLLALIGVLVAQARWPRRAGAGLDAEPLVLGMTALVLVLILSNPVLSTQYVVWLLPFVPFLRRESRVVAYVAAALSMAIFPFAYDALITLAPAAVALLVARNLALMALPVLVARQLWMGEAGDAERPAA